MELRLTTFLFLLLFQKPVDSVEIRPYVSKILTELGIDEQPPKDQPVPHIRYQVDQIVAGQHIKSNVQELFDLCLFYDWKYGLDSFYLLHYSWKDLETDGFSSYYRGVTLENIENMTIKDAKNWLGKFVQLKEKNTAPTKKNL